MKLYITADAIGTPTGGGAVTYHESKALADMDTSIGVAVLSRNSDQFPSDPFEQDRLFLEWLLRSDDIFAEFGGITHAHCYAGCLTETVKFLRSKGTKVSYTAAAHSIEASKQAHADLGMPFNYPHLTDPVLWEKYVGGYLAADLVICPSTYSKKCMEDYGCKNVVVIPHGCELPAEVKPAPVRFTVGYLGAYGPDKGVRWLLEAWKKLAMQDGTLLLAGRDSTSPFVQDMVSKIFDGRVQLMVVVDDPDRPTRLDRLRIQSDECGPIVLAGWIENVSDFYNAISLYVQPSTTEGFGIEVLEAMAHGRQAVCSQGAGAYDLVADTGAGVEVPARSPDRIAGAISMYRNPQPELWDHWASKAREEAEYHTWDKIRKKYQEVWGKLT